ncbi:GIY-YIG nuclease family protein [Burkholderia pseudomallei]|uniref:GIY-YIG nuclease family protein n=1 Tax=Burkholderia pseudomallei TaxID=28450 RepID=UPI0010649287|nr:GIY-YIG nuclease family protein [Burkholderia pseudomallei]QBP50795.1 GIY-YIG nuclease family protein [Burkholderia pseudomallei]QBP70708.1 GIY-YIG nuclease family protein [Burkholderia pseudomallei]QBR26233.1 GIY-YIG nuclease family protein [Burkholderia pseudomallei]
MSWYLYLIECADGSVYTGITTDVAARFDKHAQGAGARYTRARKPRAVLASFALADRSSASRAEYWVKRLTAVQKRELAAGTRTLESVLPAAAGVRSDAAAGRDAGAQIAAAAAAQREGAPVTGRVKRVDAERATGTPTPRSPRRATRATAEALDAGTPADEGEATQAPKERKATEAAKTSKTVRLSKAPKPSTPPKPPKPSTQIAATAASRRTKTVRAPAANTTARANAAPNAGTAVSAAPPRGARAKQNRAAS